MTFFNLSSTNLSILSTVQIASIQIQQFTLLFNIWLFAVALALPIIFGLSHAKQARLGQNLPMTGKLKIPHIFNSTYKIFVLSLLVT